MKPMKPMEPMQPMRGGERWWPDDLGEPGSSGAQDGMRYALFPARKRLLIERDGQTEQFDTGGHVLTGVQQGGRGHDAVFSGENGPVSLDELKRID